MAHRRIEEILLFWFGDLPDNETFPVEKARMWFVDGKKYDAAIAERFGEDLERAASGQYDDWPETPRGRLAYIILLDQFSRNIYRGLPQAFAQDGRALAAAVKGVHKGDDQKLKHVERTFLYMPFEHSEDLKMQAKAIELFEGLTQTAPVAIEFAIANALDYAERHAKIISRFNRFPHRNAILNRASTPDEIEFLKTPGSSF